MLAALLPMADASIWRGEHWVDEIDLLSLALIAGTAMANAFATARPPVDGRRLCLVLSLPALVLLGGLTAMVAQDRTFTDPVAWLDAWRGSKALLWAVLLLSTWLVAERGEPLGLARHWILGCLIGLCLVCLTVLWELLLDGGRLMPVGGYRVAAMFWEMRLGGGAIDVYLALTLPMLLWCLVRESDSRRWFILALLVLLAAQTLVAMQSRAVLGAALLASGAIVALVWHSPALCRWQPRQRRQAVILTLALALQVGWAMTQGGDMPRRLDAVGRDFQARLAHWHKAWGLLQSDTEKLLGLGPMQWTHRYGNSPGPGSFGGQLAWRQSAKGQWVMRLQGPIDDPRAGPLFAATQRVKDAQVGSYSVRLQLLAPEPVTILASLCERYLIYDRRCQWRRFQVGGQEHQVQSVAFDLKGSDFSPDAWLARWRPRTFAISVLTPGTRIEVRQLNLDSPDGVDVLVNGDFSQGHRFWLAAAQGRFEPWHLDNQYLQYWLEGGALGSMGWVIAWLLALRQCWRVRHEMADVAPALAASVLAVAALSVFISFSELSRLSLGVWLTLGTSLLLRPKTSHISRM
ncbi:MAG: hypothetical protein KF871_16580 [Hydrogenophaga sp.]|uniref:hypothetical protein n=1 Tax=Hydrogenophaga sp. TaxID=1904254 RepID=UPI001DAFBA73|nr:hypothetical protein [Hydrogenophaga sp.]MBX3611511.1 hypothetical protein [Hydrogenophaga sp.]